LTCRRRRETGAFFSSTDSKGLPLAAPSPVLFRPSRNQCFDGTKLRPRCPFHAQMRQIGLLLYPHSTSEQSSAKDAGVSLDGPHLQSVSEQWQIAYSSGTK
jgi:hypothetical protein